MNGFFENEQAPASQVLGIYFRKCGAASKCPDIFPSGALIGEIAKLVEEGRISSFADLEEHVGRKIRELISCEVLVESFNEYGIAVSECEYAKDIFVRLYTRWLLDLCVKLNVLRVRASWGDGAK